MLFHLLKNETIFSSPSHNAALFIFFSFMYLVFSFFLITCIFDTPFILQRMMNQISFSMLVGFMCYVLFVFNFGFENKKI